MPEQDLHCILAWPLMSRNDCCSGVFINPVGVESQVSAINIMPTVRSSRPIILCSMLSPHLQADAHTSQAWAPGNMTF